MPEMTRRELTASLLRLLPTLYLLELGFHSRAFAESIRPAMEAWLRRLHELCGDLRSGELTQQQWQDEIATLHSVIELPDLLRLIDSERVTRGIDYPADRAAVAPVRFPRVTGLRQPTPFGRKIFALRRGTAIVPHAHNNMVSAHLVAGGRFHVRTYERLRDEPGLLVISPSIDESFAAGELLTMSDDRDNVHWLVAESDHAYTFDVPVTDLVPGKPYPTPAQHHGMIHIDPLGKADGEGLIEAPILDPEASLRRFGGAATKPVAHELPSS